MKSATERIETQETLYFDLYLKSEVDLKNKQAINIIIRGVPETKDKHSIMSELLGLIGTITAKKTKNVEDVQLARVLRNRVKTIVKRAKSLYT